MELHVTAWDVVPLSDFKEAEPTGFTSEAALKAFGLRPLLQTPLYISLPAAQGVMLGAGAGVARAAPATAARASTQHVLPEAAVLPAAVLPTAQPLPGKRKAGEAGDKGSKKAVGAADEMVLKDAQLIFLLEAVTS